MDPLVLVNSSKKLTDKTKEKISDRMKLVKSSVSEIQTISGISYPDYYVEPLLTISVSPDNPSGIALLYARTIPVETGGKVVILVQLSAALILFATKATLKLVMAHELLHYIELIKKFSMGDVSSEITSNYFFEEMYQDSSRAIGPEKVFPKRRKLTKDLGSNFQGGLWNDKLSEKCRKSWIEKGLPTVKISLGSNQVKVSMQALARSNFDPKVVQLVQNLKSSQ